MAIRIRKVDGYTIALCAAKTTEEPGDIYLDDTVHHALTTKFALDWEAEGYFTADGADPMHVPLIQREEGVTPDVWDGEHCQICGRGYSEVWNATEELWEKVTGITNGSGLRCPRCFAREGAEKGVRVYWSCAEGKFLAEKESE